MKSVKRTWKINLNERGNAFILAYMTVVIFTVLSAPLMTKIISENRILERQKLEKEAFYLAEGGTEDAINEFTSAIANFQIQPNVARYPDTGTIVTVYSNSAAFPSGVEVESVITEAEPDLRQVAESDGVVVGVKTYVVSSTCEHPGNPAITVTINQAIILKVMYAFQHAVFYSDDLELLPGPNMNFSGRVHSNGDMYLDSHNTLTLNSTYVRSAGGIYNKRKDEETTLPGDVRIKKAGTGAYVDMDGLDSDSADWFAESQDRWKGTIKSSVHGTTKLAAPVVGSIQPDGYYADNAGISIINGTLRQGALVLTEGADVPAGTVATDTDFYNNREGKYVRMTNIDLRKLAGYAPGDAEGFPSYPNHLPANGLVYAARDDTGAVLQPGIRLVNGTSIYRPGGLTVVSKDPVYIQGDYNTVNKKPTAVICDSVNLLSNNWDDANSTRSLNNRTAGNTTVNTAFIAGVSNTISGNYNGGLENYPRFHEAWSGKTLSIRGSFVELWNSRVAQGDWLYGSPQYSAPNRNWDYDTDFNVNNMPPFTPWTVEAQRSAWWKD